MRMHRRVDHKTPRRIVRHRRSGWIGVDLDGTLANYFGWNGGAIGEPVPLMLQRVSDWLAMGFDVRIFTARVAATGKRKWNGDLDDADFAARQTMLIQDWTEKHLGVRLQVTAVKDFQMLEIWDDRAVQVVKNSGALVTSPNENYTDRSV